MLQAPETYEDIRHFLLIAGYGSGKSNCLIDCLWKAVRDLQGKHDQNGNDPRVMLAASTISFLERSVLLNLEQLLKMTETRCRWNKKNNIIRIGNVDIIVIPLENPDQIFGYDVCVALIDELDELPTDTAMEAVAAINQRLRQKVDGFRPPYMQCFSTAQGIRGMYQLVQDFRAKDIGYLIVRASTRDNRFLPPEYVKSLYASMSEEQARCYLDGEFLAVESRRVFPDYRDDRNMLDGDFYPLFLDAEGEYARAVVYIAQDFNTGFNNAVACTVIDKCIVFIKDYELADMREAGTVFRTDFPTQRIIWIPDITGKDKIEAVRMEFKATYHIEIADIRKNPLINDRIYACNSLFYMQRMFLTPVCQSLRDSLILHYRNRKTGMPSKGGKGAPDHKTDCLGYAVSYILRNHAAFYDLYSITFGRNFGIGNKMLED